MSLKEKWTETKANVQGWWYGFTYRQEQKLRELGRWASENKEMRSRLFRSASLLFVRSVKRSERSARMRQTGRKRDSEIFGSTTMSRGVISI